MRLIGSITLIGIIGVQPTLAFERLANLQLSKETSHPNAVVVEKELLAANQSSKLRQDDFYRRNELCAHKATKSVCINCLNSRYTLASISQKGKFDPMEGGKTSAESVYSPQSGFDPALAGGGWEGKKQNWHLNQSCLQSISSR